MSRLFGFPFGTIPGSALKPVYTAPETPVGAHAPLRIINVDATGIGLDSRTVTQAQDPATPWATIDKCEQNKQPGDQFVCNGTFTGFGIGRSREVFANSLDWIQYVKKPGGTFNLNCGSGHPNDDPAVWCRGSHHFIKDATIMPPGGSNGAIFSTPSFNAHHFVFVRPGIPANGTARPVVFRNVNGFELWDGFWSGTFGTYLSSGSGDCILYSDCDDFKIIRPYMDVMAYHTCILGGEQTIQTGTGTGGLIHGAYIRNPAESGMLMNAMQDGTVIEWCRCTECSMVPYPPGNPQPSRMGMAISFSNPIVRYNIVDNCYRGIELSSYIYNGAMGAFKNGHVHHNISTGHQSLGFFLYSGNQSVSDTHCTGNLIEDNAVWNNSREALTGDLTHDEGVGFWNGRYYPNWISDYASLTPWATGFGNNQYRRNLFARTVSDNGFTKHTRPGLIGDQNYLSRAAFEAAFPSLTSGNLEKLDPMFVNALSDFHTQVGSPLRDVGLNGSDIGVYDHEFAD